MMLMINGMVRPVAKRGHGLGSHSRCAWNDSTGLAGTIAQSHWHYLPSPYWAVQSLWATCRLKPFRLLQPGALRQPAWGLHATDSIISRHASCLPVVVELGA